MPTTLLATPQAWVPAAALAVGDHLLTVGAGALPILAIHPGRTPQLASLPAGALGNRSALNLPADQRIALQTDLADDPITLMPLRALQRWRGITLHRRSAATLSFHLARPEVIYAGPGLLLACAGNSGTPPLSSLSPAAARQIIACLIGIEAGRGLAQATWRAPNWP